MGAYIYDEETQQAMLFALLREVPEEDRMETLAEMQAISARFGAKPAAALVAKTRKLPVTVVLGGVVQRVVIAGAVRRHPF